MNKYTRLFIKMSSKQKKEKEKKERFFTSAFLSLLQIEHCNDDLKQGPDDNGNPNPDFVLTINGASKGIVGIEERVYSLENGSNGIESRQSKEAQWRNLKKIIDNHKNKHKALKQIEAKIAFKNISLPNSREYKSFSEELVNFANLRTTEVTNEYIRYKQFCDDFTLLNKYVEYFSMQRMDLGGSWNWAHEGGHGGLNKENLNIIIQDKTKKHKPRGYKENWLLITSRGQTSQYLGYLFPNKMNMWQEVNIKMQNSPFDKIFIYDHARSIIVRWAKNDKWKKIVDLSQ